MDGCVTDKFEILLEKNEFKQSVHILFNKMSFKRGGCCNIDVS